MWLARDHLKEKVIVATRAPMFVVLGAICGVGTDPARTFAALHFATRGVGGGCPWRARLLAKRVTVRPSFALVVAVQPMRGVARHALPEPVDWASQPRGARAMLALAFFAAPALRIRGVGCGLLLDLTLFITILPRKTRSIIQIVFALARNTFLAALHGTCGTRGGRTVFAGALLITSTNSVCQICTGRLEYISLLITVGVSRTDGITGAEVRPVLGGVQPVRVIAAQALIIAVFGTLSGRSCSSMLALTFIRTTAFRVCRTRAVRQGPLALCLTVSMLDTLWATADVGEIKPRIAKCTSVGIFHYAVTAGNCYAVLAIANLVFVALI